LATKISTWLSLSSYGVGRTEDEPGYTPEQVKSELDACLCELHNLIKAEVAECQDEVEKGDDSLYQGGPGRDD
jgi:hypothetical protein